MSQTNDSYVFFYDHQVTPENPVSLACFSQWFPSTFTDPDHPHLKFKTSEHYMMYRKALVFDPSKAQAIVDAETPAEAKQLGRELKGFDRVKWNKVADKAVERGNYLKFGQDDYLKGYVMATKGKILVEASETDRIWGIGFNAKDAPGKEDQWGTNRMGLALTRARDELLNEENSH